MNLLIVDDQRAIVESLRIDIAWDKLGIERVFTACSAREARLVMRNFNIDILLTDIEMPEEDGLDLFRWAKINYPDIVGIFLTSHADFEYARNALQLGGFNYILQPARYEEVERVMKEAIKKLEDTMRIHKLEKSNRLMSDQVNWILDLMITNTRQGKSGENSELFLHLQQYFSMDSNQCAFWPLWIQIQYFEKVSSHWDDKLLRLVFCNVLDEIFNAQRVKVCVGSDHTQGFFVMVADDKGTMETEEWLEGLKAFVSFINTHMDFGIAAYPDRCITGSWQNSRLTSLWNRRDRVGASKVGLFLEAAETEADQEGNEERIQLAAEYIKEHMSQSITRSQVADMLHLNEEYFSRLFKKYTGDTFKDYLTMVRIKQAKKLLKHSSFPVSIIATKVGYDNFSYFSRTFKKVTGQMPLEYRKSFSDKKPVDQ